MTCQGQHSMQTSRAERGAKAGSRVSAGLGKVCNKLGYCTAHTAVLLLTRNYVLWDIIQQLLDLDYGSPVATDRCTAQHGNKEHDHLDACLAT